MKVPFIDFYPQYEEIREEIDAGLKAVFEKGNFILGEEEKRFEEDFARYCQAKHAIGVNSGTDALYLALGAKGIGPEDEVIVPAFTFIASALCVSYTGATPVFVDVEPETYNVDPEAFARAITPRTKAVIVVHLYGQPAHMDEILAVARQHGVTVIEDACQAHGAFYKDRKVGSLGDLACFSFYPTKSLGAFGDGGMIVTSDDEVAQKAYMLRDYGRDSRYDHKIKGFNSRLDTVQAVILAAKLKRLDKWNAMRAQNAQRYRECLEGLDGVIAPDVQPDRTHVYQTYAIRLADRRDEVLAALKERGVGVLIHYPIPLHRQTAYADAGYAAGDFPVAEQLAREVLSLPMFPHMSQEQVDYVGASLKETLSGNGVGYNG